MNFIKNIVLKIANMLGLKLSEKPLICDDYSKVNSISLTAAIAQRVSTLTLMDSNIRIIGESRRAYYLNQLWGSDIIDKLDTACEVALGTGDALIKPYCIDGRIGFDIIKNGNFYICESVGDYIKACIVLCETIRKDNGNVYTRYETQRIRKTTDENGNEMNVLFIYTQAFLNDREIDLESVPEWSGIEPVVAISNVDYLLFGRIKSPTVNRENINSTNGVPITFGLDSVMTKCVEAYNRLNEEYENKEAFIFADKSLFVNNSDGSKKYSIPKGKERLFMKMPSSYDDKDGASSLINEYSPDIRDDSFINGIEQNYKMLEMLAGLSSGILTNPTTNYATATEIKASLHLTFAYMTKFRRFIEKGVKQLFYAINVLADMNNITDVGDYEVSIDWSSAYVENLTEQYTRLIQAESIGAVSKAEVRAWLLDEELEVANRAVSEISSNSSV